MILRCWRPGEVPPEFHARKSALSKTYEYRILNRPSRSPLHHHYGWWLSQHLNLEAMAAAAAFLPGEHDFSAFRASGSGNRNPVRRILAARWQTHPGGWLRFTITGNGFLRGMVRSLVGTMVEVGKGKAALGIAGGVAQERRAPPGRAHRAGPGAVSGGGGLLTVFSYSVSNEKQSPSVDIASLTGTEVKSPGGGGMRILYLVSSRGHDPGNRDPARLGGTAEDHREAGNLMPRPCWIGRRIRVR